MSYDIENLTNIMNMYSNATDDFWNNYKENVIDGDNIMSLIMDYVPLAKPKITIKIALIGVGGVGKTTFLRRLSGKNFRPNYMATVGYDITIIIKDNITYEFYDFAGQEIYCSYNNPEFYKMFDMIFVMMDKNSVLSRRNGLSWLRKVNTNNIPVIKIRNKSEVDGVFNFDNGDGYYNISTKTGQGVNEILNQIVVKY